MEYEIYHGFYGGQIICMLGKMKEENLDFILDLIDEYCELMEGVSKGAPTSRSPPFLL